MAEAAGIVLAIAPLIISAFEHYAETIECMRRFRKHAKIVRGFLQDLNVQQTIFYLANERLLSSCVEREHASQMLGNQYHRDWKDGDIARLYIARLGGSRQAIIDAVCSIDDRLVAIRQNLKSVVDNQLDDATPAGAGFKQRIKLAFKEPGIKLSMDELMQRTQAFSTLVEMTEPRQERRFYEKANLVTQKKVAQFGRVKIAADNLYRAFGRACDKHRVHQAHLSLRPACYDLAHVRFTIAFQQLSIRTTPLKPPTFCSNQSKLLWLTVESSITGTIESSNEENTLATEFQTCTKRLRESSPAVEPKAKPAKLKRKIVRFESPASKPPPFPRCIPPSTPLSNFCQDSNLCNHLQMMTQLKLGQNHCIGYLDHSGSSKHLIYINSKKHSIAASGMKDALTSLEILFSQTRQANMMNEILPQQERIRLAKQLSIAVLQFHATPWLQNSWSIRDLFIAPSQDLNGGDEESETRDPYLDVSITGPNSLLQRSNTFPSRTLIRNRLLFSLGVMLLELAFQKPFNQMQDIVDVDPNEGRNTDYYTADRVRHHASDLGTKFAEIVRKLIHCDFGCGDDISNRNLQEGYYQSIIGELERLECILA